MNKIPCVIIRDLLPTYLEHLTSEETDRLLEEHITQCQPCKEVLESMKGSLGRETDEQEQAQEHRTIDFLKKSRRRNIRITVISLAAALLIALIIVFINRYVAGYYYYDPAGELFSFDLQIEDNKLEADIESVQNIYRITGVSFSEQDGTVSMEIRAVPAGWIARILYGNGYHASWQTNNDIKTVEANGRIVWHDGTDISMMSSRIFNTGHLYIGDMSENQRVANALGISSWLGPYINELKTDQKPYVWNLILETDYSEKAAQAKEQDMEAFACVMLGMIENLDEVTFVYSIDGKEAEKTITVQQASEVLGRDIKECMNNIDVLEELLKITGLDQNAFVSQYTANNPSMQQTFVTVINDTQEQVRSIVMTVSADGEIIGSQGAENADGSCMDKSALVQLTIDSADLQTARENEQDVAISFQVITQDGNTYDVPGLIRIPPVSGLLHDIHITGNAEEGFSLEQ